MARARAWSRFVVYHDPPGCPRIGFHRASLQQTPTDEPVRQVAEALVNEDSTKRRLACSPDLFEATKIFDPLQQCKTG